MAWDGSEDIHASRSLRGSLNRHSGRKYLAQGFEMHCEKRGVIVCTCDVGRSLFFCSFIVSPSLLLVPSARFYEYDILREMTCCHYQR